MSMYNKNKSIELTRKSLNKKRSEFIELNPEYWKDNELEEVTKRGTSDSELVALRSLERIETASQGVTNNTYYKLIKNAGKDINKYIEFGSNEDYENDEKRKLMLLSLSRGKFDKVKELVDEYNGKEFKKSIISKQLVTYVDAMLKYYGEHSISKRELLEGLKDAFFMTNTDDIDIDSKIENGVFKKNEFIILCEIGTTYIKLGEYEKAFRLLSLLKKNIEHEYCSGKFVSSIYLRINININLISLCKKEYHKVIENVAYYLRNMNGERDMEPILYLHHQREKAYEGLIGLGEDYKEELENDKNMKEAIMKAMRIDKIWRA